MTNNLNNKLHRYLNHQMIDEELYEFEKEISKNEFLADALEGYKRSGASPEDLEIIEPEIISERKIINLKKILIYTAIAACLTFIVIYFITLNFKDLNTKGSTLSKSVFDFNIIVDSTKMNDSINILPQENIKNNVYISEIRNIPDKVIVPESIPPLHINKTIDVEYPTNNTSLIHSYAFKSNHHYTYVKNYKVVDYRYDKRINQKLIEISSNFNFHKISTNNLTENNTNFTYNDFLKEALIKIENKHYHEAIEYFDIILSQYPNDINACYYKALCLFETNQNQKSLKYLELTLSQKINTFHEESKWYKSMILKEEKQYAATEKVLLEIINDKGYYGVQARKELDELYKYYLNE